MHLWWQQFLLIFLRTNVIFCTKNNLDIVRWVQIPHRAASFEEFFPGAVAIALRKSAHAEADVRGGGGHLSMIRTRAEVFCHIRHAHAAR